jgi:hypothetical protein
MLLAENSRRPTSWSCLRATKACRRWTQEAGAAGLAQIVFGFYETPSVVDCANGFVVWSKEEMAERLATLLGNPNPVESLWDAYG